MVIVQSICEYPRSSGDSAQWDHVFRLLHRRGGNSGIVLLVGTVCWIVRGVGVADMGIIPGISWGALPSLSHHFEVRLSHQSTKMGDILCGDRNTLLLGGGALPLLFLGAHGFPSIEAG